MKRNSRLPLNRKLALAIVVAGLLPAIVIGLVAIRTASKMSDDVASGFQAAAANISDKIDRNLFERYGDVQAFGVNEAVNDQKSWYKAGSDKNKIAAAANRYANLYGFYLLSYVVDPEGRVIAVNDRDPAGKPIDTGWLYQKNFKDAEWFRETIAEHFLKTELLDGTYVQDLHADDDVKKIYNSDGFVLGFSAPVKDAAGKTIGVWHNCANFSLVEEIVATAYQNLKHSGLSEADITLIDRHGRVIVDLDPSSQSGLEQVKHDLGVILKANLAEAGSEAARALIAGHSGHGDYSNPSKQLNQVTGYSASSGALGYAGLKWGILVRVPETQAFAAVHAQMQRIAVIMGVSILGLIAIGAWLGKSISKPLIKGITSIRQVGTEVSGAAREFSISSHTTAEGASEQAASLEETSASLEEISAMTKRNSDNAASSKALSQQARDSAANGLQRISELGNTLTAVKGAVREMESAVSEMQSSSQEIAKIIRTIDEIAFQTNLLALNAAVEAARAGEAGAGFAVVADEVRSLAQRSSQAAKDTSEKIEAAVKRSALGGTASKKVVYSLGEIEGSAKNIEQVFNGIVTQIHSLDEVVGEISSASKEQSQGISEVNMAVSQMDKVTQSNAASAEENASAAEELNAQVNSLQNIVVQLQAFVSGEAKPASPTAEAAAPAQPVAQRSKARVRRSNLSTAPATPPAPGFATIRHSGGIPMPALVGTEAGSFKDF